MAPKSSEEDSQSRERTATTTEGDGRRDGKEEEVIFNRNGLAMKVAGPFLLKRKVYDYCCAISINKNH